MTWSRSLTLIAGIALIAVTNAVALLGVWYNRGGEPPEFRAAFDSLPRTPIWNEVAAARFEVTLAFGKRFEPWIVAASSNEK